MEPAEVLMKIIKERRSIRKFSDEDIPDNMVQTFLEAAIWAPSAANLQAWEFIIIRDQDIKKQLSKAAINQRHVKKCAVLIAVCANQERSATIFKKRGIDLFSYQDSASAIQNLLLTIHANGYGAVWVGAFDDKKIAEILKTPEGVRTIALIPIGRPINQPKPPRRYKLKKVTHLNQFGNPYVSA